MTNDIQRTSTAIDQIAEEWVDTLVDLDPTVGTYIGRTEGDGRYGDYSPAGHEQFVDAAKKTIAQLDAARPVDSVDEVTQTDLRSELSLTVESSDAQLQLRDLNVIASPAQEIREIFDLMPTKLSTTGPTSPAASAICRQPSTGTSRPSASASNAA